MAKPERVLLEKLFRDAVDIVLPSRCVVPYLPDAAAGNTVVIGAGKAAAAMAKTTAEHYGNAVRGLVITRYGHGLGLNRIGGVEIVEAGHPIPDEAGNAAAARILPTGVPPCGSRVASSRLGPASRYAVRPSVRRFARRCAALVRETEDTRAARPRRESLRAIWHNASPWSSKMANPADQLGL